MKYPVSARILQFVLAALMAVDLYFVVTIPVSFKSYYLYFYWGAAYNEQDRVFLAIFLVAFGLLGFWIMAELQLLLRSISRDPFVMATVFGLRRMGIAAVITAALLFLKGLFASTLLTTISMFILLIASLFCFTLAALFRQASIYKQEIDLTI